MATEATELRYLELKNEICKKIYEGIYENGERIPSERQLTQEYNMSRITVRKTLEILEQEHLVVREVGNGTTITLKNEGNPSTLDVTALVAHSKSPFFAHFMTEFQKCAWEHESLLLYVEVPEHTSLEDCLYRLYCKNIRNAVVWLDDQSVNPDRLLRLRSIGMNLVFFDTDIAYPFADSVMIDNEDAVKTLLEKRVSDKRECLYIGWDNMFIGNIRKREEVFRKLCPRGEVLRIPWRRERKVTDEVLSQVILRIADIREGLILFGTGDVWAQVMEKLQVTEGKKGILFAVIDAFEGIGKYEAIVYNQDLEATANRIYECMEEQIHEGERWKAKICPICGKINLDS